jgi:hypothetical protein
LDTRIGGVRDCGDKSGNGLLESLGQGVHGLRAQRHVLRPLALPRQRDQSLGHHRLVGRPLLREAVERGDLGGLGEFTAERRGRRVHLLDAREVALVFLRAVRLADEDRGECADPYAEEAGPDRRRVRHRDEALLPDRCRVGLQALGAADADCRDEHARQQRDEHRGDHLDRDRPVVEERPGRTAGGGGGGAGHGAHFVLGVSRLGQ